MDNAKVPENYRELFERAVMGPITKRDLEGTSVHARLRLIGTVRDALFDQASPGSPSIQHLNLMTIENTFKASERFAHGKINAAQSFSMKSASASIQACAKYSAHGDPNR